MFRLLSLAFAVGAITLGSTARSAEIEAWAIDPETTGIILVGDIEPGDAEIFRREAAQHESAIVFLDSRGGATIEAIEIGEAIRLRGFSTLVANEWQCDSACALIWLAGSPRIITQTARVGFHATYIDDQGRLIESGVGNALVGRYLTLLNLPIPAIIFATMSSPENVAWLDASNHRDTGIETLIIEDFAGEEASPDAPENDVVPSQPPIVVTRREPPQSDTRHYGDAGDWLVMIDSTLADSCFITRFYNNGRILRLTNDARYAMEAGMGGAILLTNPAWLSLEAGQEILLTYSLDKFAPWDAPSAVMEMGGLNWLSTTVGPEILNTFKEEFGRSRIATISRGSQEVTRLDLDGAGEALSLMDQCQTSTNQARTSRDPFAN